ncbi:hypothetical protein BDR04DRAFT_1120049 [Suillus decipiens]|nr:hypothetical protein BDR04DRAFT_1120049 [Suillus decipiens]
MNLQTCPACGCDNFTVTGLSQHLAKSCDSWCQALYRNSRSRTNPNPVNKITENFTPESGHPKFDYSGYFEADSDASEHSHYQGIGEDSDPDQSHSWEGGEDSDSDNNFGEDSNSDNNPGEDIDDSFFEPEWEVPVSSLSEDSTLDNIDLPEDSPFDNLNDGEAHNTCQDIEAQAQGQHGCVVVPYPDPCTGQRTSQLSPDQSANVMYGVQLVDDENNKNIFYPFASKIEWEIA